MALTVMETMPGGGGPWTYGLDRYGTQLLVSMSYAGQVRAYGGMAGSSLSLSATYDATSLPQPNADVEEVWSTARSMDGRTFFAWGDFHGGVNGHGIMQRTSGGAWSMFNDGANLWDSSQDGVMIVIGMVAGSEYLFASAETTIYKFRVSDGKLKTQYDDLPQSWGRDLEIDSKGRLWYARQNGVSVYDVTGDDIEVLAERNGVDCGRAAVREEGNLVHVYCNGFRDPAVVSHLPVPL